MKNKWRNARQPLPDAASLLDNAFNLRREKWDWALPDRLLKDSFASLHLDIALAHGWAVDNADKFQHT